ncbi:DUF72 domain-containing protein [Beijerinckia indica]|uniref:DUF72 domain-containing protein n=1 Tax=Beijerinckia indica subsp. indica (strain ATCC 9039 / DSM 1715 / NCIMB 8712) TaxID=395963 RepID=B2II21_BEII9|nr:DUF72 domain-containing protein [Beijerinckia indica]ACB94604.1 protein of unknown function DUF72 [Beijerinckia indica subsp. indica ATCC 9039]
MTTRGAVRIGISGWTYAPWRGTFYPKGLPQKQELSYAARHFRSIEINGTFYGLQRPESFARWRNDTPDDFVFAVKASRFITHMRKLRDIEAPLANFIASGLLRLGPKLGPILWQFPSRMTFDADLFQSFLALLPHDTQEARVLARRHDTWLDNRCWLESDVEMPLRHAVEIRNDSFRAPAFIELLRHYKTALVCADSVEWPFLMDLTADFIYCRLHGSEELYASGYDDQALDRWAGRVRAWAGGGEPEDAERVLGPTKRLGKGRDVFVFFDNDAKIRAPADAAALAERLNVGA